MARRRIPQDPLDEQGGDPEGGLPAGDPAAAARSIMLRRLTAAPRTRSELAATLAERGIPDDVATAALDRFAEVGLIDDVALAETYVASRSAGRGRTVLRLELQRRGVAADTVEEVLGELTPEVEHSAAIQFARKRAADMSGLPSEVRLRRLVGQLSRRGFAPGLCYEVAREVLQVEAAESSGAAE